MATNFNITTARPISTFVGDASEELQELGNTLQTRYENNRASLGKFEQVLNNIDVRDVNQPGVFEAVKGFKNRINEFVERGDYENITNDVFNMARDFQNNGLINAAVKDKKQYTAWKDGIETMYKEERIDHETYKNTLTYAASQNNEAIEFDEETGEVRNSFSGFTPAEYQDIGQAMFDLANDWQSDENPREVVYKDSKGEEITSEIRFDPMSKAFVFTGSEERVSEAELQSALTMTVLSNPKYMSYINQNLMFEKEALLKSRDNKEFIEKDLLKITRLDKDEFKTQVEEAGYNYDEIIADPEMREALYENFYRKMAVHDYVSPAVAKEGFTKTKSKLYDNKTYLAALKHSYALKLQKQKASDAKDLQKMKEKFEKSQAKSYINSQPGTLVNNPLKLDGITERIQNVKETISKLEEVRRSGNGDYAAITQEIEALKNEEKILSTHNRNTKERYFETPEGQKYFNEIYAAYIDKTFKLGLNQVSREFIKEKLLRDERKQNDFPSGRQPNAAALAGVAITREEPLEMWFSKKHNELSKRLKGFDKEVNANNQSSYANVLSGSGDTSGKDANVVDIYTKGLNIALNEHSKNFLVYTPEGLKDFNAIKQGYDENKIKIQAGFYDSPIYNTLYYQANIVDKTTGKVLDTYTVMPKDQNTAEQNYKDLNEEILTQRGDKDAIGLKAKQTLAHFEFPSLSTHDLKVELSNVDEETEPNVKTYSTVKRVNNRNFVVQKLNKMVPIIDENGRSTTSGKRTVYRLIGIKPEIEAGVEINDNNIERYKNTNETGQQIILANPVNIQNAKAVELGLANDFFSIEDIKLTLFDKVKN